MYRLIALLLLAACTPAVTPQPSYRHDTPITSIVFFDATRFSGNWVEVAAFRPASAKPCHGAHSSYVPRPDGAFDLSEVTCARPSPAPRTAIATPSGPGRLTVTSGRETDIYWMLWVDQDYRTAVIGMPSGKLGIILNRSAAIPADRLKAARDILEWNGYDLAYLQMIPQP